MLRYRFSKKFGTKESLDHHHQLDKRPMRENENAMSFGAAGLWLWNSTGTPPICVDPVRCTWRIQSRWGRTGTGTCAQASWLANFGPPWNGNMESVALCVCLRLRLRMGCLGMASTVHAGWAPSM